MICCWDSSSLRDSLSKIGFLFTIQEESDAFVFLNGSVFHGRTHRGVLHIKKQFISGELKRWEIPTSDFLSEEEFISCCKLFLL